MYNIPVYKLIIIGDTSVGKTDLSKQFIRGILENSRGGNDPDQAPIRFATGLVDFQGKKLKLRIWDLTGKERYYELVVAHFRKTLGVLLVYDITRRESFESLARWLDEAKRNCDPEVSIILVGNKSDLQNEYKAI